MTIFWNKIGSTFGNSPFVSQAYMGKQFNVLRLSNGIYDEAKIDETLDSPNVVTKESWSSNTVYDAKFKNNYEAGNIELQNIPIQYLLFERQEQGSLKWELMYKIKYVKGIDNYQLYDYYIKNNVNMTYRFSPICQNIIGVGMSASIKTSYDSLFLTDSQFNMPCRYDLQIGDVTTVNNSAIIETLVGQYPVILNSATKYRKGKINITALSKESIDNFGNTNTDTIEAENVLNQKIEAYLNDGKPKLMRYNNLFLVVKIQNPTRITDSNHSVFSIWEWSFDWIEVSGTDMLSLLKNNLTYDYNISST